MLGKPNRKHGELLYQAERFRVESASTVLPSGEQFSREIIRHPGAVVILPVLHDGRICLIENYRLALEETLLELPAGTREAGEAPEQTALRELAEETGYRADSITPLCDFHMSPGIMDEHIFAFLAEGLHAGAPAREPGEQIVNRILEIQQADQMIRSGELQDAKSVMTLLFYLRYHASN